MISAWNALDFAPVSAPTRDAAAAVVQWVATIGRRWLAYHFRFTDGAKGNCMDLMRVARMAGAMAAVAMVVGCGGGDDTEYCDTPAPSSPSVPPVPVAASGPVVDGPHQLCAQQ